MTIVAVIPARAGSKRLPGKNLKLLAGRPLIVWSIEAAKDAGIGDVIVTTDGESIAEIAREAGARVVMRPSELATDTAATLPTVRHAIEGTNATTVVLLQPTTPLRNHYDIEACLQLHGTTGRPVISMVETPPWVFRANDDGGITKVAWEDGRKMLSPNGAIYICSAMLLKSDQAWWDNPIAYEMPKLRSIDIDTLQDFELAGALVSHGRQTRLSADEAYRLAAT